MSIPCRSAVSPHFLALHARHFYTTTVHLFFRPSFLQVRVNLVGKVLFFRAKTLITRRICCIQLDRHIVCGDMAWLEKRAVKDKYHPCPDIWALRCAFVAKSFDWHTS